MPLRLWRIISGPHPVWSGEGARLFGARWNPPGITAIYAGTSFALCLVEILVHANRKAPPSGARFVEAVVPDEVSRETFDPDAVPGWGDLDDISVAQRFGRAWLIERRSALLLVPSVVTGGRDTSAVVNPSHPDAAKIAVGPEMPVALDRRLFGGAMNPDLRLANRPRPAAVLARSGAKQPSAPEGLGCFASARNDE